VLKDSIGCEVVKRAKPEPRRWVSLRGLRGLRGLAYLLASFDAKEIISKHLCESGTQGMVVGV
jgi:hypothetical protein